jgi:hypothetical protein
MDREAMQTVIGSLRVSPRRRRAIARELQSHVDDTRRELVLQGWDPRDAERESIARLGDFDEIVDAFGQVYRPSRRTRLTLAFGLAGTLLLGVYGRGGLASATSAHRAPTHSSRTHAAVVHRTAPRHTCHHTS